MVVFDNLIALDGLIQVIYHSTACFVLISNVENEAWVLELGLVNVGNRWWRGSWSEKDVLKFTDSQSSDGALKDLSAKLTQSIVSGELSLYNWDANQKTNVKLHLNVARHDPAVMELVELPDGEGSVRAVTILKGIALQAQSRGCRINYTLETHLPVFASPIASKSNTSALTSKDSKELRLARERIQSLENEVTLAKQAVAENLPVSPSKKFAHKPPPGASRANPTRQKRKIVEAEFESD